MRRNSPTPNFKSKEFIFVHSFQKIGRGVCRALASQNGKVYDEYTNS